jgi:hypothetical protein
MSYRFENFNRHNYRTGLDFENNKGGLVDFIKIFVRLLDLHPPIHPHPWVPEVVLCLQKYYFNIKYFECFTFRSPQWNRTSSTQSNFLFFQECDWAFYRCTIAKLSKDKTIQIETRLTH